MKRATPKKKEAPSAKAFREWEMANYWGKRTGWKDGEERLATLYLCGGEKKTGASGASYYQLWTNYEYVTCFKEVAKKLANGSRKWWLVKLKARRKGTTTYFNLVDVQRELPEMQGDFPDIGANHIICAYEVRDGKLEERKPYQ